jgi:hypothetical protein
MGVRWGAWHGGHLVSDSNIHPPPCWGPGPWTIMIVLCFYICLYQLLAVPRGLWRSGNVPKRVWGVLELLYIELLIKIYKTFAKQSVVGHDSPSTSVFFQIWLIRINISRQDPFFTISRTSRFLNNTIVGADVDVFVSCFLRFLFFCWGVSPKTLRRRGYTDIDQRSDTYWLTCWAIYATICGADI